MRSILAGMALLLTAAASGAVSAAERARIELSLGASAGAPFSAAQQWVQVLSEMKLDAVRIHTVSRGEKPSIEVRGEAGEPVYVVKGLISPRNELWLPGGRFARSDAARLADWFETLRTAGPSAALGEPPQPFGMPPEQLAEVRAELARPLDFSTVGLSPREMVLRLERGRRFAFAVSPQAVDALASASPMSEDLVGFAAGTSLAITLRPAGLTLRPTRQADQTVYAVVPLAAADEPWPVGRSAQRERRELAPEFFSSLTIQFDNVALARVVEALAQRLKLPVFYDHHALAAAEIDPTAERVTLPEKRTTHGVVLRRVLAMSKLVGELRTDDAGRPFLWITTFRPIAEERRTR